MKYSFNWIKEFVQLPEKFQLSDLRESIWESLAEIEKVEEPGKLYEGVVIAHITHVEKHPKSEKLMVAKIDDGSGKEKTIVTGAHNIKKGDFVPYLPVGSTIPKSRLEKDLIVLEERNMIGITSHGMLASQLELNLGEDHTGILIIASEDVETPLVPGQSFVEAFNLNDALIEIENKSMTHRGDCFSIVGISREVAAITGGKFIEPDWLEPKAEQIEAYVEEFDEKFKDKVVVDMKASDIVPRYSAIILNNIIIKPSPLWLQVILIKHGIKPINNVVDITNYIMLEWGQPLHAFDASVVNQDTENGITNYNIVVRRSQAGEKISTLDNKEHVLDANTIVIADKKKLLGIAGIIGGTESAISKNTTKIILESATFDMYAIRKSSMIHGLFTDASTIFSRKQDPTKTVKAMLRAIDFLQKYAGAKIASTITDEKNYDETPKEMVISPQNAREFIGVNISDNEIIDILKRLNYEVTKKAIDLELKVPSYRSDILIDEDVYEEIIRIYRYSKIQPELPMRPIYGVKQTREEKLIHKIQSSLTAQGLFETLNFSFVSEALYGNCLIDTKDCYKVINAVSPDVQYVRKLLIPGLLQQGTANQFNEQRFGIFEFGHVARKGYEYGKSHPDVTYATPTTFGKDDFNLPIEDKHLGAIVVSDSKEPVYYELKQYIDRMLSFMVQGIIEYKHITELPKKTQESLPLWIQDSMKILKGGRTAIITASYDGELTILGILGEVNSIVRRGFGLQKEVAVSEMNLHQIQDLYLAEQKYREPSIFPSIQMDYCFEVPLETKYVDLINLIYKIGSEQQKDRESLVNNIQMIDIYSKTERKKQITVRITYQSSMRTLKENDVKFIQSHIIKAAESQLKAKLV